MEIPAPEVDVTDSDDNSPGQRRRTGRGHVDSYGEGRVCEAPECETELSRYNSSGACWLHDRTRFTLVSQWTR
ncbi:MAG TPA: hypothetical protein VGR20_14065 [Acidimicrobiia bacterium]|jgi:hypothetical protein|nr:hypothetical protein [Acidimicrobiia bacterium]